MPLVDDGFEALLEPFYNGKKLTDPISTKEDKFQLLPAFLKVKGQCFLLQLRGLLKLTLTRSCETVRLTSTSTQLRYLKLTCQGTLTHTTFSSNMRSKRSSAPTALSEAM